MTAPNLSALKPARDWRYYCEDCSDSGWLTFYCLGVDDELGEKRYRRPWVLTRLCGEHRAHVGHEFADRCPCASSNPDVQRKLESARRVKRTEEGN
jgi:hypothetical protein